MADLQPPRINTQDAELSESDDHFSSADEGTAAPASPIPTTRVERVDDQPAHGEVPNTPAYAKRLQDAVPDEIEVVPEGHRSRSGTRSRAMSTMSTSSRPQTPGGTPVPKTVVERVDNKPAHGEVEGTLAKEMRSADAEPDEVRQAPAEARDGRLDGSPVDPALQQAWFRSLWEGKHEHHQNQATTTYEPYDEGDTADDEDDAFGDEFDEFAEEGGDDDFGDFDEAEDAPLEAQPEPARPQPATPDLLVGLPPLNFVDLSEDETDEAMTPYFSAIFPDATLPSPPSTLPLDTSQNTPFLSDRSLSLWQQLVSPPPMQPPNWTRSRIRRLFLVSLGVPVDLDEILPPSKQKRLILPNINLNSSASPRPSTALDRLKGISAGTANSSTTSLDSKTGTKRPSTKRTYTGHGKGPPPPPDFDLNAAALLCGTTGEAMQGLVDGDLREHVFTLEILNRKASAVLEYWLLRKDEGVKEKEALEGVIENLVGFVKGRRG